MSSRRRRRPPGVSVVVRLSGPLSADATDRAAAQVEALLRAGEDVVVRVSGCDVTVVDAVARLRLVARRCERPIEVVGGDVGLFELCGLEETL
jgi:hypothetical protein